MGVGKQPGAPHSLQPTPLPVPDRGLHQCLGGGSDAPAASIRRVSKQEAFLEEALEEGPKLCLAVESRALVPLVHGGLSPWELLACTQWEGARAGALVPKTLCPWAGGAVLTPVLILPLQPTCTSAQPCGRAAVCASKPTRASSAAGACRKGAARCGSTAWPTRAAGCMPAAATAAAPTPRSPRYTGTDGR